MKNQFVVNKTMSTLIFKNGYITIPRGSYSVVATEDTVSYEFTSAVSRGWIDITDKAPTETYAPAVKTVVIESGNTGMTAEQLKAELAASAAAPAPSAATVEALGGGAPAGSSAEATVESIGKDSTVEVNPAEAEASKPAAKTARKAK